MTCEELDSKTEAPCTCKGWQAVAQGQKIRCGHCGHRQERHTSAASSTSTHNEQSVSHEARENASKVTKVLQALRSDHPEVQQARLATNSGLRKISAGQKMEKGKGSLKAKPKSAEVRYAKNLTCLLCAYTRLFRPPPAPHRVTLTSSSQCALSLSFPMAL